MPRSEKTLSRPPFVADWAAMDHSPGQQVDWDAVPADYAGADGQKRIPAGTVMSKTDAGKVVPRAGVDLVANADQTASGLLVSNAAEGAQHDAKTGYGLYVGGSVYEELLPDAGDADLGTYQDELAASGTGWRFEPYENSIAA